MLSATAVQPLPGSHEPVEQHCHREHTMPVTTCGCAGIGVAGQALGSFLLATEMIGPSLRGVAGIITQVDSSILLHSVHDQS